MVKFRRASSHQAAETQIERLIQMLAEPFVQQTDIEAFRQTCDAFLGEHEWLLSFFQARCLSLPHAV